MGQRMRRREEERRGGKRRRDAQKENTVAVLQQAALLGEPRERRRARTHLAAVCLFKLSLSLSSLPSPSLFLSFFFFNSHSFIPPSLPPPSSPLLSHSIQSKPTAMAPVLSLPFGLHRQSKKTLAGLSFFIAFVIVRRQQALARRRAARQQQRAAAAGTAGSAGSSEKSRDGSSPIKSRRVGVDKHFLEQLKKLLPICIPGYASKEAGLLAALATILIARYGWCQGQICRITLCPAKMSEM